MPTAHSALDHFFRMIAPYQPWKYGIIPILVGSEARAIAFFQGITNTNVPTEPNKGE